MHHWIPTLAVVLLNLSSIGCALALKFCGGDRTHEISKTRKSFGEIPPRLYFIKIINIFNGVPKSKHRKIKILMGVNENMGEKLLRDEDQVCFNLSR